MGKNIGAAMRAYMDTLPLGGGRAAETE